MGPRVARRDILVHADRENTIARHAGASPILGAFTQKAGSEDVHLGHFSSWAGFLAQFAGRLPKHVQNGEELSELGEGAKTPKSSSQSSRVMGTTTLTIWRILRTMRRERSRPSTSWSSAEL